MNPHTPFSPKVRPSSATAAGLWLVLGLLTVGPAALAQRNPNPGVRPPHSSPYGDTYGEWSGAWWRWTYSIPADLNPVSDPTGEFAAVGQSGPLWFLAGNFGGTTVRHATVPAGKGLLLPILNAIWINIPELGDDPWSDQQREFARALLAPFIDNAFDLSCTIDGVAVAAARGQSRIIAYLAGSCRRGGDAADR